MLPSQNLDIIDIEEQLKFQNHLIQAKGYSLLADRVLKQNLGPKDDQEHRKVLFDCFFAYGNIPRALLLETLPVLVEKDVCTKEVLLEEFSLRLSKFDNAQRGFHKIIDICEPSFREFLQLTSKINTETLTKTCLDRDFQKKHSKYTIVLLFSGILSQSQKKVLGNQAEKIFLENYPTLYPIQQADVYDTGKYLMDCSQSELISHSLNGLNVFQLLKLMEERPEILKNKNLPSHVLYLPFMFLMSQFRPLIVKTLDESSLPSQNQEIRGKLTNCQAKIEFSAPNFTENPLDLESLMCHVISHRKVENFVLFVENYKERLEMFKKSHILPFLTVILAYSEGEETQKRVCELVTYYVGESVENADGYVLYFIGLFVKPFFGIEKTLVLDTLVSLAVNRFAITPIITFLTVLAQKGDFRCKALHHLSILVAKYPSIIPNVAKIINLAQSDDSEEVFKEKLHLAKECCVATDDCDEILSSISKLLKENGTRLSLTVDVIKDLVEHDVLDLRTVRKQLQKKVVLSGNESALAAYCRLLAVGSIPNSEDSEEENSELKAECVKDLKNFTKHSVDEVASEAWKSLGKFGIEDLEDLDSFGVLFGKIPEKQYEGFVQFLGDLLEKEKESYQRPLYNLEEQSSKEVPPLLSKIDTFKDQLLTKNKEEVWFWTASLPLSGAILQLAAPSNKALNAVRLLKACLLNVPPATSNEEMLRLMAAWRSCVSETFGALAESKGNDLIWARDQICQEGRLSLTQKSESVDNIMMMLTALTDVVDERIRTLQDDKLIVEIQKSQKPWLISVLEFVATRLPKEVKQRREQKVNPIYQVLTHSNKSSLFIAIFCTRLLYRNPDICEFYGDGKELLLTPDPMFQVLLNDSTVELNSEEIPDRKSLWITAKAYGADELTVRSLESIYQPVIDEKSPVFQETDPDNIEEFFNWLIYSPKALQLEIQTKHRKVIEKLWNNGTEQVKRRIYEGLSELALISDGSRKRRTVSVEKLSNGSVLRAVLQFFDEKSTIPAKDLQKLIKAFVGHRRKDGRFLPPIDWLKILEKADWKSNTTLEMVGLACEQQIPEVLFASTALITDQLFQEHFATISKLLPRKEFLEVLRKLENSPLIASHQKHPIVRQFLIKSLPKLEKVADLASPLLKALKEPHEFGGWISACFDVWLEVRNGEAMNMKRICETVNHNDSETQKVMLAIISLESGPLSTKKRLEKILDVITASRISRSTSSDMSSFLPIVFSLMVSPSEDVDVPLFWFDNENDILEMMTAARKLFFRNLMDSEEMVECVKHIGSFLRPYVEGDEADFYEEWQRNIASELLLALISKFPSEALPNILQEHDNFWNSILLHRL